MNKQPITPAAEKAMQSTLSEVAKLSNEDASEYLSAIVVTAISMLRTTDGEQFVYGFLRSALASLAHEVKHVDNPHGGNAGLSVHVSATLANPDAITAVEDLRRELHQANDQLIERDIQLADQKAVMNQVLRDISPILIAHTTGQAEQVNNLLNSFCARHVVVKTASGKVPQHFH